MANRVQTEDQLPGVAQVTPEAHEVNTFAAPLVQPPPENDRAKDISNALSELNPQLQRFAGTLEYKVTKKDVEAGQALRVKNQNDWNTAVKSGQVPEGASPWFRMGYDKMDLELQAQTYDSSLRQAYATSGARNSDNPKDLQSFIAGFQDTWIKQSGVDKNPQFNQTMAPLLERSQMALQQTHAQNRINDIETGARDKLGSLVGNMVGARNLMPSPDDAIAHIQRYADDAYAHGMNGQDVNRLVGEAIVRQAVIERDFTALDMIKKVNGGSGPIGNTAYGKELIKQGQQEIIERQRADENHAWTQREHEKQLVADGASSDAITRLAKNPNADLSDIIQKTAAVNPDAAEKLQGLQKRWRLNTEDDPRNIAALNAKIYNGTAQYKDITDAVTNGYLSAGSVETLTKNMEMARRHDDLLHDLNIESMKSRIYSTITGGDIVGVKIEPSIAAKAEHAQNTFILDAIQWKEANPTKSIGELYIHMDKFQQFLVGHYQPGAKVGKADEDSQAQIDKFEGAKAAPAPSASQSSTPKPATPEWATKPHFDSLESLKTFGAKLKTDSTTRDWLTRQGINPQDYINAQYKLLKPAEAAKGAGK